MTASTTRRSDEALSPEQVDEIGPDVLPGAPSPRPNGGGAGTTAPHAVTAIQSGRGAKSKATGESDTGEADRMSPSARHGAIA